MTPPLSVGELAQFLGMSTKWVYQQLAKGEIPACKIGGTWFIDRPTFEAWFQAKAKKPQVSSDKHSLT